MRKYFFTILYHFIPFAFWLTLTLILADLSNIHNFLTSLYQPNNIFVEFFFVWYLVKFVYALFVMGSASKGQDFNNSNFTIIKCGENGTGKTLTGVDYALAMAEYQDYEFRKQYKLYKANEKKINKDKILRNDLIELKEYVEFWDNHEDCIPGLFSTVPIEQDGLHVMQLKREHVLQYYRLPYGSVCLYDEAKIDFPAIGTPTQEERAEETPGADFISKVRHYGNFHFVFISQKSSELRKFIRNNVSNNEYLTSCEKVLEATALNEFTDWLEDYFFDVHGFNFIYKIIFFLKNFSSKIGFFKFKSYSYSNTETEGSKLEQEDHTYFIPKNKGFIYDSRCYRNNYKAKRETLSLNKAFSELQR